MTLTPATRVLLVWLGLAVTLLTLRAPTVELPGMYYDEAFMAQQARDFLEPQRALTHPPGTASTFILGRPFPTWNAAYLGALKSQLLIPALAVFGSSVSTVRLTTLGTALLAMLFFTLWTRRLLGTPIALVSLVLVLFDPSFLFFSTYEWGPYTTLLLCRGLGLYLLTVGWQQQSGWRLGVGGLVLGLGVYARADFGVVLACGGAALLLVRGRALIAEAKERKARALLALTAGLAGALPMLASVVAVLETSATISNRGDLAYKGQVLWTTLDGSHYYRVIREGGLFESLFTAPAPSGLLAFATLVAVSILLWQLATPAGQRASGEDPNATVTLRFLLITLLLLAPAMWLVPGAVRAHHMLNLLPVPHLLVAAALVSIARLPRLRVASGLAGLAILVADTRVTLATDDLIAATGGRGRFSASLHAFAAELESEPSATAVALDWGFYEPLSFLTTQAHVREPIWAIPRVLGAGRPWQHAGDETHRYLVHDLPYDLFQLGPKFLATARALRPDIVQIEPYLDREGNTAFYSVRFLRPHQLVYTGEFSIHFP